MVREKIIKKLNSGCYYVTIYPEKDDLYCPICKQEMNCEESYFVASWFCENPKCKAYLKRHGGKSKGFLGGVQFHKDKIKQFLKNDTQLKEDKKS